MAASAQYMHHPFSHRVTDMADVSEVNAKVQFRIGEQRVTLEMPVPAAPIRPRQLLPLMRELTGMVVAVAEAREASAGRHISCAAGCGTCCRQLVPIAPSEAREIAALIETLPEPRRTEIRERYRLAVERLTVAGLIDDLRQMERVPADAATAFGLRYFALGIACPFLEDESCSIHPKRPLACREFLVTSDPRFCAEPATEQVAGVPLDAKVSRVLRQMDRSSTDAAAPSVPLILAPEWAASHADDTPPRPGPELLRDFIAHLTGKPVPPAR